jgi:hypothetical protein
MRHSYPYCRGLPRPCNRAGPVYYRTGPVRLFILVLSADYVRVVRTVGALRQLRAVRAGLQAAQASYTLQR